MSWFSQGLLSNPAQNDLLADSGAIGADQNVSFQVAISTTIAAQVVIEHRNAANTANVHSHLMAVGTLSSMSITFPYPTPLAAGERVRLRLNAAIVGSIQGSLFTDF